jgi:hypothetical protein
MLPVILAREKIFCHEVVAEPQSLLLDFGLTRQPPRKVENGRRPSERSLMSHFSRPLLFVAIALAWRGHVRCSRRALIGWDGASRTELM